MTILTTYSAKAFHLIGTIIAAPAFMLHGWRKCVKDESHVVHILNLNIYRSKIENFSLRKRYDSVTIFCNHQPLRHPGNEAKLPRVPLHLGLGDPSDSGSTN